MAIWPWIKVIDFYGGDEILEIASYPNVTAYLARIMERPASQAAVNIPSRDG